MLDGGTALVAELLGAQPVALERESAAVELEVAQQALALTARRALLHPGVLVVGEPHAVVGHGREPSPPLGALQLLLACRSWVEGELVVLFGPPAVGKMTVGRAVCAVSDFRLFHNHHTIEPLHEIFGQSSPAFGILNAEFRRRVIEEAALNDVRLVFTTVWNLAGEGDAAYIRGLVAPYQDRGLPVRFVELYADLATRLARNAGPERLAAKPSKRDLESVRGARARARGRLHDEHRPGGDPPGPRGAGRLRPPPARCHAQWPRRGSGPDPRDVTDWRTPEPAPYDRRRRLSRHQRRASGRTGPASRRVPH